MPGATYPLLISVDRVKHCNAVVKAAQNKEKTAFVLVRAGEIRERHPSFHIVADKPPPEHGEIRPFLNQQDPAKFEKTSELKMDADMWNLATLAFDELAKLAKRGN